MGFSLIAKGDSFMEPYLFSFCFEEKDMVVCAAPPLAARILSRGHMPWTRGKIALNLSPNTDFPKNLTFSFNVTESGI